MSSPSPSPTPISSEQLELIKQVQNNQMPPLDAVVLWLMLKFPLPEALWSTEERIGLFKWLTSTDLLGLSGASSQHPLIFSGLLVFWPVFLIVFVFLVYYLIKSVVFLFNFLIPIFFSRFLKVEPKTYLELTFPSDTSKSAYATSQLYTLLHTLARRNSFLNSFLKQKKTYSLEIVSTREEGIRYILVLNTKEADIIKRSLMAYLPGIKVREVKDYLEDGFEVGMYQGIVELKLGGHFALPLQDQKTLKEHDPISYLTGQMTRLASGELISFQVVTTPVLNGIHNNAIKRMHELRKRMSLGEELVPILQETIFRKLVSLPGFNILWLFVKATFAVTKFAVVFVFSMVMSFIDHRNDAAIPILASNNKLANALEKQTRLNPYEQELKQIVKEKIDQQLFESSMRILIVGKSPEELEGRISGLMAAFGLLSTPYQMISSKGSLLPRGMMIKQRLTQFTNRLLSQNTTFNQNPILSITEISDIYHFPYTDTTKTEDLVKLRSRELPAPLTLKNNANRGNLDVVFGENTYGDTSTDIGLTEEERQTHMYILGRTGSGKTTLMFSMAKHDIQAGRGMAFIDPHGDVAEDLLASIPLSRKDDLIYINPHDLKYPIGINVLELTPGLDEDEAELEKEVVCEGVISLFKKVFSKDENANAHRIEHILRNTIYTVFYVEDRTLFTINKLLTNAKFRREVLKKVDDEDLLDFWKSEFGKAGDFQVVKMTQGVTAKVGRFLRSPTARRMLEQTKSTINFDEVLNGKILICNLSQGKLGEDTTKLIGTTILTKLQQAALKRSNISQSKRKPFYLYIDEFQNFATLSFIKIISEGRKYGLHLIIAEQSTSQQQDRSIVNQILANVTTVVSFRSGNFVDEELMLNQFSPYLLKGEITNLPRYRFYIKISAIESEEPFSGTTIYTPVKKDSKKIQKLIDASRKNWAIVYKKPVTKVMPADDTEVGTDNVDSKGKSAKSPNKTKKTGGLPKLKR